MGKIFNRRNVRIGAAGALLIGIAGEIDAGRRLYLAKKKANEIERVKTKRNWEADGVRHLNQQYVELRTNVTRTS